MSSLIVTIAHSTNLPTVLRRVPWSRRILVLAVVAIAMIVSDHQVTTDDMVRGVKVSVGPPIEKFVDDELLAATEKYATPYFATSVEVRPDHSVLVTERIGEYFVYGQRGIFRDIPLVDWRGTVRRIRSVEVRTTSGTPDDVKLQAFPEGLRIRIGDPDVEVTGSHGYQISYVVENAMSNQFVTDAAVFDFSSTDSWPTAITRLIYEVSGPNGATLEDCAVGNDRADVACDDVKRTENGLSLRLPDGWYRRLSIGLAVGFPRTAFDESAAITSLSLVSKTTTMATVATLAVLLLAYGVHDWRVRRSRRVIAGSIDATFTVTGAQADRHPGLRHLSEDLAADHSMVSFPASAPIEFVPPLGLDPAQVHRLSGRGRLRKLMASTLLDLAADGVVDLVPENDSFRVSRRPQPPREVTDYELILLQGLLGDSDSEIVSDRREELNAVWRQYLTSLDESLKQRGLGQRFWTPVSDSVAWWAHINFAALLALVTAVPVVLGQNESRPEWEYLSVASAGVVAFGWALTTHWLKHRRLTPLGRAAIYRIQGFQRFFTESEGRQARFAERHGLMREYMGYALIFDSLKEWVTWMPADEIPVDWRDVDVTQFDRLTRESVFDAPRSNDSTSSFDGVGDWSGGGGDFRVGGGGGGRW